MLVWAFKAILIGIAGVIHGILEAIAVMGGTTIADVGLIGPDDIIFNRIEITNIDFFDFSIQSTSPILAIRQNVAKWYYAMRILAIGILLVILIYCGVRMAITTIASDKAKYREMLINWAVSFALVFLLHYYLKDVIMMKHIYWQII